MEPHFHLDLDRSDAWTPPVSSSKRLSPYVAEAGGSSRTPCETPERRGSPLPDSREDLGEDDMSRGVRQRPRGELSSDERSRSPRRGLQKYLSRFDDAIKLRGQLTNEKAAQDSSGDPEELDSFRLFRLTGSVLLAVFVRIFVCQYLVSERCGDGVQSF